MAFPCTKHMAPQRTAPLSDSLGFLTAKLRTLSLPALLLMGFWISLVTTFCFVPVSSLRYCLINLTTDLEIGLTLNV